MNHRLPRTVIFGWFIGNYLLDMNRDLCAPAGRAAKRDASAAFLDNLAHVTHSKPGGTVRAEAGLPDMGKVFFGNAAAIVRDGDDDITVQRVDPDMDFPFFRIDGVHRIVNQVDQRP